MSKVLEQLHFCMSVGKKLFHLPEPLPAYVQISLTNHCNLSCPMCIRNYIEVDRRHMQWGDFVSIVDKLAGVRQVSLAGMGESLSHPQLFEAIRYCHDKGLKTQLTTNALLLTDEVIDKIICSGLHSVSFSIESLKEDYSVGHGNAKVVRNIARLLQEKQRRGATTPKIVLQPILFKDKVQDVYDIIKWGSEVGVDRVNIVRVDLRFVTDMERPSVVEEKVIFRELSRLRKKYRIRVDCLQDQIFAGFPGLAYKYLKYLLRLDSWCYRFQDFIYVNVNGNVHPCCLSEEQVVGNLLEQTLKEVWLGEKFQHLRRNQQSYAYCQKCDFLRLKQVS